MPAWSSSGTMTDRRAAEAVGLHPDSAAYTKSKPRVRAYMLEHRAAVQQQLVEQDTTCPGAGTEQHRFNLSRDQVLDRLWEIANLGPEMTRGSITGQVKALSMIIAIEGLIPDRRAASAQNKSAPPPVTAQIYTGRVASQPAARGKRGPPAALAPCPGRSRLRAPIRSHLGQWRAPRFSLPHPTPEPTLDRSEPSFFGAPLNPSPTASSAPRVPMADYFAPDTRVPFSIKRTPLPDAAELSEKMKT